MMRRILAGCVAAACAVLLSPTAVGATEPTTRVVDDDQAQCKDAAFDTITAAVAAADPGDTVKVCPGVYRERVEVGKQLQLVGRPDAINGVDCFDAAWSPTDHVDPARFPVIEPPDDATGSLVRLQADGIELAGFVVQGQTDPTPDTETFAPAVQADGASSGHRIDHNLIQNNTLAVELGSNGDTLSRVDHNCLRGNAWAVANQRYTTKSVRVDHNDAFRTAVIPFEVGTYAAAISHASFDHNHSVGSGFSAYLVERAASVRLEHNTVESPAVHGVFVRGGNRDVAIADNHLTGTANAAVGINITAPVPQAPTPSSGILAANNAVEDFVVGILVGNNAKTTDTRVLQNTTMANRLAGIQVSATNTGALVQANTSDHNAFGIRTSSPAVMGNRFVANSMHANSLRDAMESSFTTSGEVTTLNNTWDGNACDTDSPVGTICRR